MVTPNRRRPTPESGQLPRVPVELFDLVDQYGQFYIIDHAGAVLQRSQAELYASGTLRAIVSSSITDPGQPPHDLERWERCAGWWDEDEKRHPGAWDNFTDQHPEARDPRVCRQIFAADSSFVTWHLDESGCPGCLPPPWHRRSMAVELDDGRIVERRSANPWPSIRVEPTFEEERELILSRRKSRAVNPFRKE
jgi:hypothetical protein